LRLRPVLSTGDPRDAAVNFETYCILQRHRAASLPQHGFLVYISDSSNTEITRGVLIFTAVTQSPKITAHDQNYGKSHGDREYVIILER